MFPDTITIYRHSIINGADIYDKEILSGFYWYGKTIQNTANKGTESVSEITVVSGPEMAKAFGEKWTTQIGDIIIKGKGNDISSLKELTESHKIYAVNVNVCNSDVDNIVLNVK